MLAHELRNPLASAATNLAVVADLCEEADPRTPFLARAEQEMDRIRDLLTSCLDLACAGRVRSRDVALEPLINAAVGCVGHAHRVAVDVAPGLRWGVDPVLVARAVENLLENALRASGDGEVHVTAAPDGNGLCIRVEDAGPGVPAEIADRVFEPFVSGTRGTGLGLAFVRQVVAAHGGRVASGRSTLGGARFDIWLPLE